MSMFWCCLGLVLGDVPVMSRSCLGLVSVVSWSLGDVSVLSRSCLCPVSLRSRSCLGLVPVFFVMSRCVVLFFLVVFWGSFIDVLVTSGACFGEVSVMRGDGTVVF